MVSNRIGFDKQTWLTLAGILGAILAAGAALAVFTFQTKADALVESARIIQATQEYTNRSIDKHEVRPHAGAAKSKDLDKIENRRDAIMKRLEVIGDRVGAGRAVRAVRPMSIENP